jgi:hypothetical protein
MAVTVVVAAVAVVVVSTAAAASAVVVAMAVAASMAAGIPAAAITAVCTEVVAATAGWAEGRRRHAVPAPEGPGLRRAEVLVTPRLDGIRLEDQETVAA